LEENIVSLKDYFILVAATIAATASVASIFVNFYLSSRKERENKLWEKELERFFVLEEKVGVLVENLMSFRCREDTEKEKYYEMQQYLASAIGRFRRYPNVLQSLRLLQNEAGWYFRQDMKHETKEDYNEARSNLEESYQKFLKACDEVLKRK
jgi:hypothetical protein